MEERMRYFFILICLQGLHPLLAQERSTLGDGPASAFGFTLSGIVKDEQTGETLPFSTVRVRGTAAQATTNADGYFTLHRVPSDTATVVVSHIGYGHTAIKLSPSMSKTNLVLEIKPTSQVLDEVSVSAAREDVMQIKGTSISTITMTPKNLRQLPNVGERDIMRSFQLMPGISASNESSSGMYVRGGTPDQNLILYDGFTIYHVDHLFGFFSAFNANAVKDVQLHKGGFESRFGERLSSITEITGKDGNQKHFNIGGDLSLLSANVFAELPIGDKFTSLVAFRRSYRGPLYNAIFKQFNDEDHSEQSPLGGGGGAQAGMGGGGAPQEVTPSSYFYDLNGKFTYRPTDKDIISYSIFNGTDNLDNGFGLDMGRYTVMIRGYGRLEDLTVSDLTLYGNFAQGFRWARKWSPKLYGNTVVSYSSYYSDRERMRDGNFESSVYRSGFMEDNNLKDFSVKSSYRWDLLENVQLHFGAFATYYDIQYNYTQNDTLSILDRRNYGQLSGAYLQSRFKFFGEKVQFTPGFRANHFDVTGQLYYEPRASLLYNAVDGLSLKGAYGKYYQFANRVIREDFSAGSRDFWILSNGDNVPVSSAEHYIAGLAYETNGYLFSAEGYYKKLDGLSEYTLRFDANFEGIDYNEYFYNGIGYARGIELLVQKKLGKLNGWVSYTLGEARNRFDVYGPDYFPAAQDVTHEFKAVGLYKYRRWDFSATWIYATGRPYTAPSGAYTITLLDGSTQNYFTTTAKNGMRLTDYHRLDVAANYKFRHRWNHREIGSIGVSLFNVYNRRNAWYKQYDIVEGQIIETDMNYLGLMPNVSLSLYLR